MPAISDYFGLTRVIHLPDRLDRLREITAQLEMLGIAFTPGKVEIFSAQRPTELAGFPNLGARGCFLSHLGVLVDARRRGMESVLVLEDDLQISKADCHRVPALLAPIPDIRWHFLHLGHLQASAPGQNGLIDYRDPVCGLHLYALHSSIFDRLIDYLSACLVRPPGDPVGGPMHVDGAFSMFRAANPDVVTLIAQPSLARQRSSRSDISPRWLDRLPGVQLGTHLARGLVRAVRSAV